jgi:sporulation protein YlmC with PRC-barrel domain
MNQTSTEQLIDRPLRSDHSLILSSRVNGTPVFDSTGEQIGEIDDLSIERVSGEIAYAIMSSGGFLGIGAKYHALPWSLLEYDPEHRGYVVSFDKAALKGAPHYGRAELEALGGPSPESLERIYGHYSPFGGPSY